MEYISIGKLKILKSFTQSEGVFVDTTNNEQKGTSYRFLLDGIAKYSLVVEYLKFNDGTGSVGLGGDFAGPKLLYNSLYSRLRIGIFQHKKQNWCEIRIPKESEANPKRLTAQKVLINELDNSIGMKSAAEFLLKNGGIEINTREVLVDDTSNRKSQLSVMWNSDDLVFPIILFVITRLIPITQELIKQEGAMDEMVYFGEKSTIEKPINLNSLLKKDENSDLEFKKSSFFSANEKTYGQNITHDLERTIVGMLNGVVESHILIGVDKSNNPVGIRHDFELLETRTTKWDTWLLMVRNHLVNLFGLGIVANFITIGWHDIGEGIENPVGDIFIKPLPNSEELQRDRFGDIWIRTLNGTQKPYSKNELDKYLELRKESIR